MSRIKKWKPFASLRTRNKPNLPANFMQDHIEHDLSPALVDPPLELDNALGAFTTTDRIEATMRYKMQLPCAESVTDLLSQEEPVFEGAKTDLEGLQQAIMQYRNKSDPQRATDTLVNPSGCTWNQIQEIVRMTSIEMGSDDESSKAKGHCSSLVNNLPAFESWLKLLPSGDYGTVISGAFTIVLGAVNRAHEVRVSVLRALAFIPECFANAVDYQGLYADGKSVRLMQKTAHLCSAVLTALRHIILYFTEGTLKGSLKALLQGQAYKKKLQDHLAQVQELTTEVHQEASIRAQHRLKNVEDHLTDIKKDFQDLSRPNNRDDASKQVDLKPLYEYVAERLINSMFSHLASHSSIDGEMTLRINGPQTPEKPWAEPLISLEPSQVTIEDVCSSVLTCPQKIHVQDLQRCIAEGYFIGIKYQDRMKWIMKTKELQLWLQSPRSTVFLINGNDDQTQTFAATTCLSAKITDCLQAIEPIIVLHFFCSLHTFSKDGIDGTAVGFVKNLILQLLQAQKKWNLAFLSSKDMEALKKDNLQALCSLFGVLLQQLPPMTLVFLMIDGITVYERTLTRQGFLLVVKELMKIIDDQQHLVIKMLLTCRGRSAFVGNLIDRKDILNVPEHVDGDHQGWSEHAWNRSVGNDLRKLEVKSSDYTDRTDAVCD